MKKLSTIALACIAFGAVAQADGGTTTSQLQFDIVSVEMNETQVYPATYNTQYEVTPNIENILGMLLEMQGTENTVVSQEPTIVPGYTNTTTFTREPSTTETTFMYTTQTLTTSERARRITQVVEASQRPTENQ